MQQNLLFINEFEDHLIRIQNLELFQGTQSILNTTIQNNYQTLLNKTITYDENFVYQTTINNKLTDKVSEHQDRLDIIGPCVHKINNDYVTHSEITGFASDSAVTALSVSVGLLQTQCIAMDAGIAAAQSTATAAAATSTANSGLISTLQSQVVKLEGENAMLTSDVTEIKAEQTTIKVDAAKVAADLKKFEIGQGLTDAGLQSQLTDLSVKKADKETTYTKQEMDAFLVTQSDTNTQLNGGILQLGSTKADQVTTYTKTDIDNKLSLKTNVVDVYTKTTMDGKLGLKANAADVYTKTQMDTSLALKSDKTYVDTGFNLYGGQLTTLKNRADNVDILNTTQNTNITNLQNSVGTLNNGMNTAFSRLQVIDNLNTQQNASIVSLQTDNTTNKTDIGNLKTSDTKQNTDISELKTSDTKQNTDIETLKTRCTDIETVNTTQDSIIEIHTGNFEQINDNFTDVWGRLDKIEQTDLVDLTKRFNKIDENLGDTMTSTYYLLQEDTKNKANITVLQNDNTTNKSNITTAQTNITNLTNRMNQQDQDNLTFGTDIYDLWQANVSINSKVSTLQTQMSDVIAVNNNQALRITNLETFVYNFQTQGTGWQKTGNTLVCTGYITTPGSSQSATVSFPVAFKTITSQQATIVASLGNGGGGVDSCYIYTTLTSVTVRHDYTSSSKTGNYHSWRVEGTWQ
ncbi:golgin_subfamily B member 1-like [Hexamita inflata]|uniref:Golgin subfamily B member 1-like n=1 Tax=Hexamita inflata TaxID=28002 RepID=A0AA86TKK5_9EUKA|nr:golgin subfamily B member 1-like [Hexamita inflata]